MKEEQKELMEMIDKLPITHEQRIDLVFKVALLVSVTWTEAQMNYIKLLKNETPD